MKTIMFVLIILAFYNGAIAQYYDLVASKNINNMLITFTENFLANKGYAEFVTYDTPVDTVWSTLEGKLDSNFITPCIFYGIGYIPFDYHFEHKIFTDGSGKLKVYFKDKVAFEKVEYEVIYKNNNIINANIKCIWDLELQSFNTYSCSTNSIGLMEVSTSTLKEFEERLQRILPYLK